MSNNAKKNALKHPENTNKTFLRLFEKVLKIQFSAEKSGSRLRFRTMLNYIETLRTHQLNMFWGFLRIFWKSGSRPRCRTMLKQFETLRKHHYNMVCSALFLQRALYTVHCTIQCTLESRRLWSPTPFLVNTVNRYFVIYMAMKYETISSDYPWYKHYQIPMYSPLCIKKSR